MILEQQIFPSQGYLGFDKLESNDDLRGIRVYDKNGLCFGFVSEIFCDGLDFTTKYIEITEFNNGRTYFYPFDQVSISTGTSVKLNISFEQLSSHKEYDSDYVKAVEGSKLVTYDAAIDMYGFNYDMIA